MAIEKITVPDLGEASDVEVIELLVTVGQQVAENDSLLVLESDKAAMEIPAPMAGIVKSIAINLGDTVSTGVEILSLEVESNNASAEQVADVAADETQQAPPQVDEASPKQHRRQVTRNSLLQSNLSLPFPILGLMMKWM